MRTHRSEYILTALLLAASCATARLEAASARNEMRKGLENMEAEEYLPAATNFVAAAELAAGQDRSPAVARFNAGNALYRAGEMAGARENYSEALDTDDIALQARAFYNLGNIDLKQSEAAIKERRGPEALELYEQSIASYEKAITLAPEYIDPKFNYELAGRRKYNLLRKVDLLRDDMEKARRMGAAADYAGAVGLLREKADEHELAFQIEPELKKRYEEIMKRTEEIADIVEKVEGADNDPQ